MTDNMPKTIAIQGNRNRKLKQENQELQDQINDFKDVVDEHKSRLTGAGLYHHFYRVLHNPDFPGKSS